MFQSFVSLYEHLLFILSRERKFSYSSSKERSSQSFLDRSYNCPKEKSFVLRKFILRKNIVFQLIRSFYEHLEEKSFEL